MSHLADSWNLARRRLDKTFSILSTCTKEFTKELDEDEQNAMFNDGCDVSLAVVAVVRSLKLVGHNLTNRMCHQSVPFQFHVELCVHGMTTYYDDLS